MRRIIVNIAFIIFAFSLQICIFPFIPFLYAAPNLLIILTFTYGFSLGVEEGMLYGVICGILMDLYFSGPFGFFTLLFLWIGFVNGKLTAYFYEEYIFLPFIVCTISEIMYNVFIYIFRFFIREKYDVLYYLKNIVIPEVIITLIFTLLLYRFLLWYNKKLRVLDSRGKNQ
ncbi:rod shape-determining protein MreD [Lachnospiraceae oral taxon 107 str. F0167]|mgnify:FL=1|jgi:rod shape-determining protein mreD|uniref:rod shape-determining protein MreD n=1 Tax=Lachnoanaerobaculum sp. Marseille-Q4761 TaxID=2819511 RepID=UPI000208320D|nr:rod shape-determining protein MreD [Lachnoanaerobaculum sp. Marseille-Q4761]EGG92152.1 rod shape-determining protein MreD [Lachnospiraceae oral taxon 107 str. F0167]MBO1870934.1 rod shape-determining protein MreD [Lachnoanaerobaculum sp. Marseille-Q4761]RKW50993.1 MAG: rod shape-determining protein MreD [Lachnospiraceae bacterium]